MRELSIASWCLTRSAVEAGVPHAEQNLKSGPPIEAPHLRQRTVIVATRSDLSFVILREILQEFGAPTCS
jgi:hypothetical protein